MRDIVGYALRQLIVPLRFAWNTVIGIGKDAVIKEVQYEFEGAGPLQARAQICRESAEGASIGSGITTCRTVSLFW